MSRPSRDVKSLAWLRTANASLCPGQKATISVVPRTLAKEKFVFSPSNAFRIATESKDVGFSSYSIAVLLFCD